MRLALQAGRMATWEHQLASDRLAWSDEARAIFQFSEDPLPQTFAEFLQFLHPDDREVLNVAVRGATEGQHDFSADFRFIRPGGEPRWFQSSGRFVNDEGGVGSVVAVFTDVTERRYAEEHLRYVQRMEAITRIAGGIAHEANNQMTVVEGFAEFILRTEGLDADIRADVEQIRLAAERTAAIVQQLLAFSRRQVTKPETVDLCTLLRSLAQVMQRALKPGQRVETSFESTYSVRVDQAQFAQVMLNLAFNARDAMEDEGVLRIASFDLSAPAADPDGQLTYMVRPGEYGAVTITDTGTGMPPEVLDRIFEPFYTTKAVGEGTGLGLASVYGIVKQANGYVWARSEEGVGSTFEILLPRHDAERAVWGATAKAAAGGQELVLVVEDEPAVRRTTVRTLQDAGYFVLEARDAAGALELVGDHRAGLAMVVTDVAMPGLDGRQLADEIRKRLPDVTVLLMSGFAYEPGMTGTARNRRFLAKPFAPANLLAVVREMLDDRVAAMASR